MPQDDLTSPRIANIGLGLAPTSVDRSHGARDERHGSPKFDEALEDSEAIDEGFTAGTRAAGRDFDGALILA